MILDNASYNKVKLVYELSKVCWFIEKHAIKDAQDAGDTECAEMLLLAQRDLQKYIERLQRQVCMISQ